MSNLQTNCPYCNQVFEIPSPKGQNQICEIISVPYTRDIGRFDPKDEEEWLLEEKWTQIGKDYLTWLNWERFGYFAIHTRD